MRKFLSRALSMFEKLDKKQIEKLVKELAAENEILESAMQSMTAGVIVVNKEGIISFANRASRRIIPLSRGELIDNHYNDVILDPEIRKLVSESEAKQETVHDREFAFDAAGGPRIITCSILPLLLRGEISGNLIYLKDITQRKVNEARLRRAESLASLTTFTAGVAHEIKNPLGAIGIHIQLMQKALARDSVPDPEFFNRNLNVLSEEVERLNSIVVDFLFAVRPMDVNLKDECLNEILTDILNFVKPELDESNIEIETDFEEDIPLLQIDEKLIKQAILNIVKNAKNAMENGGHLNLSTARQEDSVVLQVKDDGEGIPEENLNKIFEPYFTTKDFGSGLGLTLVYKIIKEHDGEIQLKSKVGEGTVFILRFPVPQKERHLISWDGA